MLLLTIVVMQMFYMLHHIGCRLRLEKNNKPLTKVGIELPTLAHETEILATAPSKLKPSRERFLCCPIQPVFYCACSVASCTHTHTHKGIISYLWQSYTIWPATNADKNSQWHIEL